MKPGHKIVLSDFPAILKEAMLESVTPRNIIAGFAAFEVWPIDATKFTLAPSETFTVPSSSEESELYIYAYTFL